MDIKQEIAELKAKLAELETKEYKSLDCYFGEGYYVKDDGIVSQYKHNPKSKQDYLYIRNKGVAEKVAPLVQIQRALVNFKCEHDQVFDRMAGMVIYTIEWSVYAHEYIVNERYSTCSVSAVWFSTKELAQSALDMLKRRKLI